MSKKIIVTGAYGQLGRDVVKLLEKEGYKVFGYGRDHLDFTNFSKVEQVLNEVQPEIVIHSGAYTKVDQAELDIDTAFLSNAIGTRNIAVISEQLGAKLVYISTDYVFNGEGEEPYTEFDRPDPISIYGKSKLAGEEFIRELHTRFFILRTSWVFGKNGNNFVKTLLKLAENNTELKVVDDQRGCPTYTVDLAECISNFIDSSKYGTYHVSNSGECSWFEFAKAIFEIKGIQIKINPVSTKDFPRSAPRPKNSVFDHMGLRLNDFPKMRNWKEALQEFLSEELI